MPLADQFKLTLQGERCRPHLARARPASYFLMLKEFLRLHPHIETDWGQEAETRFHDFRMAEQQTAKFAHLSTAMKRMTALAVAKKVKAGMDIAENLQSFHGVSVEECVAWQNASTATSKRLLPVIRKFVKDTYGVRLGGGNSEWTWTVPVGPANCTTLITFGGPFCQFAYERHITFPDSSRCQMALTWEEHLGEARPQWDLMTAETMVSDLDLFFTFCREMESRISSFVSSLWEPGA